MKVKSYELRVKKQTSAMKKIDWKKILEILSYIIAVLLGVAGGTML